jgi:hypothetical protein
MINLEETVLAQYSNSPILMQLVNNMNAYIDPYANLNNFYNQVWNVLTAVGYGLDRLGRVVGVSRTINIPFSATDLGFREAGAITPLGPGGSAPFWDGSLTGNNYRLTDTAFRTLILVKAISNISVCSAQAINQQLTNLFGSQGRCYSFDLGNMQMQITFEFPLSLVDFYILTEGKALSRPCGVLAFLLTGYVPGKTFGFREAGFAQPLGPGGSAPLFSGNYHAVSY